MQFKAVHYSALINLGNYNNERIGFSVQIGEQESPEETIELLRQKVSEIGGKNAEEMYSNLAKNQRKLDALNQKIKEATDGWNRTAEFLRAQGLKPEAPEMPQLTNLLPQAKDEYDRVVEGEIDDDSDDDEDSVFEM